MQDRIWQAWRRVKASLKSEKIAGTSHKSVPLNLIWRADNVVYLSRGIQAGATSPALNRGFYFNFTFLINISDTNNPCCAFCESRRTHRIRLDNSQHDGFFAAPGAKRQQITESTESSGNNNQAQTTTMADKRKSNLISLAEMKWDASGNHRLQVDAVKSRSTRTLISFPFKKAHDCTSGDKNTTSVMLNRGRRNGKMLLNMYLSKC